MITNTPRWHKQACAELNQTQQSWLLAAGSLTQKLIAASDGDFSLRIIRQGLARARLDEARALKLPPQRLALIREIIMSGGGQDWVFARSILPLSTLTGRLRQLKTLGNRPLGALLFSDPSMTRSAIEISRLAPHYFDFASAEPCWGRRSVFRLDQKPLLVTEVFLTSFTHFWQD